MAAGLQVYTVRLGTFRPRDLLDATRRGADAAGTSFLAPSWAIVTPMQDARATSRAARTGGQHEEADRILAEAFAAFEPAYAEELRVDFGLDPRPWRALLARPRVVLGCLCPAAERARCHLVTLARFLAAHGATPRGEYGEQLSLLGKE
jgi:hypothetical protein